MNRGFVNCDIVKQNINRSLIKSESSNPLHTEYVTVTRNGKTHVQRYKKKTPTVESPKDIITTKDKATLIDKIFHSHYYDKEFYDNNGKKMYLSDEWKEYGKKMKIHSLHDKMAEAYVEHIHLMDEEGLSDEEKQSIKKQIYQSERKKFLDEILPKIKERNEKIDKWFSKNETRLKNIYEASFSKEGILSATKRSLSKISTESNYKDLVSTLELVKNIIGSEVNDKPITYKYGEREYTDTVDKFLSAIKNRIDKGQVTNFSKPGISDVQILNLPTIPEDKIKSFKTWDKYKEQQLQYADNNLIK